MYQGKRLYHWVIMACLVIVTVLAEAAEKPRINCSAEHIYPGDFFKVQVAAAAGATVMMTFLGQSKELTFDDKSRSFIGLAASSYRAKAGKYPLSIAVNDGLDQWLSEREIEILPYSFPEERITVPEPKRRQVLTPKNQASDSRTTQAAREKAVQEPLPPLWEGPFVEPVQGRRTAEFGVIRYVNNIENGRHSGWDIAVPVGTPVAAVNHGRVVLAEYLHVTGYTVILHHGLDLYSSYAHLSKLAVAQGQDVAKGETVGLSGMTGLATGPHLHLTFRVGEIPVNPGLIIQQEVTW